jgi:hypothetical protein
MNIAQLAHVVTGSAVARRRDMRRLGPCQVTALTAISPDADYALQELLRAVQALAQGGFQGAEAMRTEARSLANDLAKLGANRNELLRLTTSGLDTRA